ncbi:hypothetical protein LJR225_003607 [Phenylobacterium sp. LjRoot225]|uniref:hypothetical protein n=1 Tax=Phenylobacterium sp. LjRoot225 TaxID=3342285 RepID=UPI003ECDAB49
MTSILRPAASLLGAGALALTLGGCKIDNRPLLARGEPPPAAPALGPLDPALVTAMPAAYPAPDQAYAYPQRAYAMSQVVRQRPPSYAFSYGDEEPWAWDAADQGLMFAEPVDDSWRYYYYEPGAVRPYFIQDRDYGYAYGTNGVLLALFDAAGALIAADRYHDYGPRASGYWTRAYDLQQSYRRSPRRHVEETVWRERAPAFAASHDRWFRTVSTQPAWNQALRRDNGRHLGWYKAHGAPDRPERVRTERDRGGRDRSDHDRGRQIAVATPSPQPRREAHAERPPPRAVHDRKAARQEVRPHAAPNQKVRPESHGGQAFARAAGDHGRPAASHGPAKAQAKWNPPDAKLHAGGGGRDKARDKGGGKGGGDHKGRAGHDH